MNTEHRNKEFKIPHSTITGYPFSGMPSKDATPPIEVVMDDETHKVAVVLDNELMKTEGMSEDYKKFVEELKARIDDKKTAFEDFLLFRLYEMKEALVLAEQQVLDILEEHPFIPENLGFELVHKQASTQEQPQRIYGSKYSKGTFLFRKPGDVHDATWNPSIWTIQQFKDNGDVTEEDINLPCNRIAFAYFYAKGIQMEEFEKEFTVEYRDLKVGSVFAGNEKGAIEKAKKLAKNFWWSAKNTFDTVDLEDLKIEEVK